MQLRLALLITALLLCTIGCTKQPPPHGFAFDIRTDGQRYGVSGATQGNPNKTIRGSAIVIYPHDGSPVQPTFARVGTLFTPKTKSKVVVKVHDEVIEENEPGYFRVFICNEEEVVSSKSYDELGIDANKLVGPLAISIIKPTLETMIREHVKPNNVKE